MNLRPLFAGAVAALCLFAAGCSTNQTTTTQESTPPPTASEPVTITEDQPVADASPDASPSPAPIRVAQREIEKDPFDNPLTEKPTVRPRDGNRPQPQPQPQPPDKPSSQRSSATVADGEEPPAPPEPGFSLTGLVNSPAGNKAIVSWDGESRVVSVGDQVGGYRVTSIQPRSITVSMQGHAFQVPMRSEFARP